MTVLQPAAQRIVSCGLVPIFRFQELEAAMKVTEALKSAGVDVVEFPMTSPLALKAIEKVKETWGDSILVGAGTVLDAETARTCMLAGAGFIVVVCGEIMTMPGLPKVPAACAIHLDDKGQIEGLF